jgi:hypothetical protein
MKRSYGAAKSLSMESKFVVSREKVKDERERERKRE